MKPLSVASVLALVFVLLSVSFVGADPPVGTGRAFVERSVGDCYMIYCPPDGGECSSYAGKFRWVVSRGVPGRISYQCHAKLWPDAEPVHATWETSLAPGCYGKANLQGRAAEWIEHCEGYWEPPW